MTPLVVFLCGVIGVLILALGLLLARGGGPGGRPAETAEEHPSTRAEPSEREADAQPVPEAAAEGEPRRPGAEPPEWARPARDISTDQARQQALDAVQDPQQTRGDDTAPGGAEVVPFPATADRVEQPTETTDEETTPSTLAWLRSVRGVEGDHLLNRMVHTVGRSSQSDIVLSDADRSVSRRHCTIRNDGERWWLVAGETSHGTFVNQRRIPPLALEPLQSDDVIGLGHRVELKMFIPTPPPPDETVPDPGKTTAGPVGFRSAGATAVGGRRTNQDSHHASGRVVAVADGVGGRPAGELASRLAIHGVLEADTEPDLPAMIRRVNQAVRHRAQEDPSTAGMATTLDLLVLRESAGGTEVYGAHVGDGIMLLQTGSRAEPLTREHTLATELVDAHQMSARELRTLPERGTLLRAVGLAEEIAADFWQREAVPGDRYVLASDGLLNALGMDSVQKALRALREFGPDVCAHELVDSAIRARASDNVTVVVADVVADEAEADGSELVLRRGDDR